MIKYAFTANGELFIDSTVIENQVLKGDSISLNYDKKDPLDNLPELDK